MKEFIYLLDTGQPVKILSKKRITENTNVTKIGTGELQIRIWEHHIAEDKMAWCMPPFPEISPKKVLEMKFIGEIKQPSWIIKYMKSTGKNIHCAESTKRLNFTGELTDKRITKSSVALLIKQKLIKQTISEDGNEYIYTLL